MKRVLITGASGFVGRALVARLMTEAECPDLIACSRHADKLILGAVGPGSVFPATHCPELDGQADWSCLLDGVSHIVHLAGTVHAPATPSTTYRRVNVDGTLRLASQAAAKGVRRFLFVSTIKVNGEGRAEPYSEADIPAPVDEYACSKWEAEQGLLDIAAHSGMEIVILRPPLIYGPGVGGNFLRLMRMIERGWPMPFASVRNLRSLLYVANFADLLVHCLRHPDVANKHWMTADGSDFATPDLIRALAKAMAKPHRLFPCPQPVLRAAAGMLGAHSSIDRLLQSLVVDGSRLSTKLGWKPRFTPSEGLQATVDHFIRASPDAS